MVHSAAAVVLYFKLYLSLNPSLVSTKLVSTRTASNGKLGAAGRPVNTLQCVFPLFLVNCGINWWLSRAAQLKGISGIFKLFLTQSWPFIQDGKTGVNSEIELAFVFREKPNNLAAHFCCKMISPDLISHNFAKQRCFSLWPKLCSPFICGKILIFAGECGTHIVQCANHCLREKHSLLFWIAKKSRADFLQSLMSHFFSHPNSCNLYDDWQVEVWIFKTVPFLISWDFGKILSTARKSYRSSEGGVVSTPRVSFLLPFWCIFSFPLGFSIFGVIWFFKANSCAVFGFSL